MDRYLWWFFVTLRVPTICFTGADVPVTITAAEGGDPVLPCFGRTDLQVSTLSWSRSDDNSVLLVSKRGRVMEGYQHPNYTNRVLLQDPQLQRGDLSVVLKNVTLKDSGTYKCLALYEHQQLSQFIQLNITKPNEPDTSVRTNTELRPRGYPGLFVGLSLLVGLVGIIVVLAFLMLRKRRQLLSIRHLCSERPREPRRRLVSSSSTTTSEASDRSTKVLVHPGTHLPQTLPTQTSPALKPLSPFTHPLLPSSSPSSTLSRSYSDSALSGFESDTAVSKPTIPHRSSFPL